MMTDAGHRAREEEPLGRTPARGPRGGCSLGRAPRAEPLGWVHRETGPRRRRTGRRRPRRWRHGQDVSRGDRDSTEPTRPTRGGPGPKATAPMASHPPGSPRPVLHGALALVTRALGAGFWLRGAGRGRCFTPKGQLGSQPEARAHPRLRREPCPDLVSPPGTGSAAGALSSSHPEKHHFTVHLRVRGRPQVRRGGTAPPRPLSLACLPSPARGVSWGRRAPDQPERAREPRGDRNGAGLPPPGGGHAGSGRFLPTLRRRDLARSPQFGDGKGMNRRETALSLASSH